MEKILGLDLETNRIGWAIVKQGSSEFTLVDKGVRVFTAGVKSEKGIESSRASERTAYRSARKIKYRRKLRKYYTLKVLSINKMCPLTVDEVEGWKKSGFKKYPLNPAFLKWLRTDEQKNLNPYYFRDMASREKVTLLELGRAFYHITQRRGFLSNKTDQSGQGILEEHSPIIESIVEEVNSTAELLCELKDYFFNLGIIAENNKDGLKKNLDQGDTKLKILYNSLRTILVENQDNLSKAKQEVILRLYRQEDLGLIKKEIGKISQAMSDGNFSTLGQYLFSLYSKERIRKKYTAREEHYLKEFEILCRVQGIQNIDQSEQLPEKRYAGLARDLYKAIFFQRPLKFEKGTAGKCPLEKNKSRCAASHPDFEEYRMWNFLNTIKYGRSSEKTLRYLTLDEKLRLIPKFLRKKNTFVFEDLAKELIPKEATSEFYKSSSREEFDYLFNYNPRHTVMGCPVSASLKKAIGENWKIKTFTYTALNSNGLEVCRSVNYGDLWHMLSVATSNVYLFEYAKNKLGLDLPSAKAFSSIKFRREYGNLSLNAIDKILPYLKQGLQHSHAVLMGNVSNIVDGTIWDDPVKRKFIQDKIGFVIENHTSENGLVEAMNSLIKEYKANGIEYSQVAETGYKSALNAKLVSFFRYNAREDKNTILNKLLPIFIDQLKGNDLIKTKSLMEKVMAFLAGDNEEQLKLCSSERRLNLLYNPSNVKTFKNKIIKDEFGNKIALLGSPVIDSVKNPMAMRTLHQLRALLNTLIREGQIDPTTKIHINMAPELSDANKRKAILDYQNELKKKRQEAREQIGKLYATQGKEGLSPTDSDVLRYQLWVEQNKAEIYEGNKEISICDIVGEHPRYNIFYTIPRSISRDNSQRNMTLCSKEFKRDTKRSEIFTQLSSKPEIGSRIVHWKEEADKLSKDIEALNCSVKAAASREARDSKIRRRHYLSLKRDYLQAKFERFFWTENKSAFKNGKSLETGNISKHIQSYLKSYFERVEVVQVALVDEFRKIWKMEENYQKNDLRKHSHCAIDAIIVACMTRDKYKMLFSAWDLEEKEYIEEAKTLLAQCRPWKNFTEDLKKIEHEIQISHHRPDNVKKQSKKIIRIRGKKQFVAEMEIDPQGRRAVKKDSNQKIVYKLDKSQEKVPRFQQGDTIRGSLHQEHFYGAIKNPLNHDQIYYVIRKDLLSIKAADVESIVDHVVKEKVKQAIENKVLLLSSNQQQKNKLAPNSKVWMNKEKGIAINKVRLYANAVKNPLEIREHSVLSKSPHEHKQKVYGQNNRNYAMVLYETDDIKEFELINNFSLAKFKKQGLGDYPLRKEKQVKGGKRLIPVARRNNRDVVLKRGLQVVFYDDERENPKNVLEITDFAGRIYTIEGLTIQRRKYKNKEFVYGKIILRCFNEARGFDEIIKENFKPAGGFRLGEYKPIRNMNHIQFSAFVEGIDFKVLASGKIVKI
ncbi:type II CRISPR RNA-guided endonuclease Cas9 [Flavobacterium sp. GA093]|uniref:CRISPR-associated endonuclease Cas9 n=1 Tax=Flavobacterium hydrocarbonoxydans TaxID=2683249 RepID=A0A6I4NGM6_9FLAO|nr:type II CRISPR RNA-guided endonuclease Cas9 [Flavobacterium hydrocarbonoxydans]MWB93053.1 type II CRISPR RNA-guided endonuclease Cas9 [Flavobacterium hydrocarbonoxydans]